MTVPDNPAKYAPKLLPTYRKLRFREIYECDICGSRIHLRLTLEHSNWHLWLCTGSDKP